MAMTDAPTCRRCGAELASSYHTELVSAAQHRHEIGPDGSGFAAVLAGTSACSWNCLAVLAAQLAGADADAAVLVLAERERQVTAEGYTPEADTAYPPGVLARAGVAYAWDHAADPDGPEWRARRTGPAPDGEVVPFAPDCWPWDPDVWKPKDPERDLVRAAALVAAEADRLVRARRAAKAGRF